MLRTVRLKFLWSTLIVGIAVSLTAESASAKPPLGRSWPRSQRVSMDKIDHSAFSVLLKKYVDADGYVNYRAWQASASDRGALQNYLAQLGRADASARAGRSAQLAFWINAYNALTLEGMLQLYPTSSIRNHTAKAFGYNIWKQLPLIVGDGQYTLDTIENRILRRTGEPRIHFAIVCASISCPRLRNEAYTAARLEQQLTANTKDFFSRSNNFQYDARRGVMKVSSIINWFGGDFGKNQTARFRYLKPYLPADSQQLAVNPRTRVRYLRYNWGINDQARKQQAAAGSGTSRQ